MKYFPICDQCVEGNGSECHNPQCCFCLSDVPKVSNPEFAINLDEYAKIVDFKKNPDEPVNYVGVHPIRFQMMKDGEWLQEEDILGFQVSYFY